MPIEYEKDGPFLWRWFCNHCPAYGRHSTTRSKAVEGGKRHHCKLADAICCERNDDSDQHNMGCANMGGAA